MLINWFSLINVTLENTLPLQITGQTYYKPTVLQKADIDTPKIQVNSKVALKKYIVTVLWIAGTEKDIYKAHSIIDLFYVLN